MSVLNPYSAHHLPGSRRMRVYGPHGIKAYSTTPTRARAQMRLLHGVEHGMMPRKNPESASGPYGVYTLMPTDRSRKSHPKYKTWKFKHHVADDQWVTLALLKDHTKAEATAYVERYQRMHPGQYKLCEI
jgi:hypothetical protein